MIAPLRPRHNLWGLFKSSLVVHLGLLFLAVFVGYGAYGMARRAFALSREARETEQRVEELRRKKEELEAYLDELETRAGVERIAKERFNLKNHGERVVVVLPKESETVVPAPPRSFWADTASFFGGILHALLSLLP